LLAHRPGNAECRNSPSPSGMKDSRFRRLQHVSCEYQAIEHALSGLNRLKRWMAVTLAGDLVVVMTAYCRRQENPQQRRSLQFTNHLDSSTPFTLRSGMRTLANYPYVTVRLGCSKCERRGQYRLAAKFGADMNLVEVLAALAGSCPKFEPNRPGVDRCGAHFVDLNGRPQPDSPALARALRVIK